LRALVSCRPRPTLVRLALLALAALTLVALAAADAPARDRSQPTAPVATFI